MHRTYPLTSLLPLHLTTQTHHTLFCSCACQGTVKYVHRECLQKWIDESHSKTCELCRTAYVGPFRDPPTAPPPPDFNLPERLTILGREYILSTDETGNITARRIVAEEYTDDDLESPGERLRASTACLLTGILLLLVSGLMHHLFSVLSRSPSMDPSIGPAAPEKDMEASADEQFQDITASLLIVYLLMRILLVVAPFYLIGEFIQSRSGTGMTRLHSEIELEDIDLQTVEEGLQT